MNKNRMWVIGSILAIVATLAGGWVIGIAPQVSAAALANSQRLTLMQSNAKNEVLLAKLKRDYQNIDALKNEVVTLQKSIPTSADVSSFVTELNSLANARKVTLKSITVSDAKAYTPTNQSTPGKSVASGSAQTNPKIGTKNFVTIPVAIGVTGDYGKVLDFVNDVQLGLRLFLVSALSTTGSTNSKGVKGNPTTSGGSQKVDSTITGYMYVLLS